MTLSRDEIVQADDLETVEVEVPKWGGSVYIRELTSSERGRFEEEALDGTGEDAEVNLESIRERLLVKVLCDEDGERLFGDDETDDLAQKSGAVTDRLFREAQELNGFTQAHVEAVAGN